MNANEIDELFEAIAVEDYPKILEMLDYKVEKDDARDFYSKNKREIIKTALKRIEEGDFQYFWNKRKHQGASIEVFFILASGISDNKYLFQILEDKELIKKCEATQIVNMIIATKDTQYIKSILEDEEKRNELKLYTFHVIDILKNIKDPYYIKYLINYKDAREKLGIKSERYLVELIKILDDQEYMIWVIEDEEFRQKIGISSNGSIVKLLNEIKDEEYVKNIIESEKLRTKYGIGPTYMKEILKNINDPGYIRFIIKYKKEELGLDSSDIIDILKESKDTEFIKSIIKGEIEGFELTEKEQDELISTFPEEAANKLKSLEIEKEFTDSERTIKLPENMTIGVEIESEGRHSLLIKGAKDQFVPGWECKGDASVRNGVEVVSPILTGDNQESTNAIKMVCRKLDRLRTIFN